MSPDNVVELAGCTLPSEPHDSVPCFGEHMHRPIAGFTWPESGPPTLPARARNCACSKHTLCQYRTCFRKCLERQWMQYLEDERHSAC
eukprot:3933897-Rhodomonas_salina.10